MEGFVDFEDCDFRHCAAHHYCDLYTWKYPRHSFGGCRRYKCRTCCCHNGREFVTIDGSADDKVSRFKISIDVHNFTAEELRIKAKNGDTIIVEGNKSSEKKSSNSCACSVSEFKRVYKLPRNYNAKLAEVTLGQDSILTIEIPATLPDNVEHEIEIVKVTEQAEKTTIKEGEGGEEEDAETIGKEEKNST